jgi:predicted dehydrogenase
VNSFLQTKQINLVAAAEVYAAKADLFKSRVKEIFEKNEDLGVFQDFPNFVDYREVLSRKDIDAVVIATPDHWHGAMAVKAAQAGKDIYCEKPLALTIKEGRAMVNAARKHKRVFQTGSMQRSWPEFRQAAELIRNGYIGDIKQIVVNVGPPPKKYDLQEETIPEGLDWMKWLGPNEFSVFNAELAPPISKDVFPNWRNYKEFGGGMVTDWGAHMFDIVQWALDMDASGPTQILPPDGKEIKHLTYIYANGIKMTHEKWDWNNAIKFVGAEGEIRVQRRKLESNPESLKDRVIKDTEIKVYKSENHYVDFLDAMRSRKKPICDVEIGHRTASVCTLGNIAYELGVPLSWNPKKEAFDNNKAANQLLGRKLNKEWGIKI